eukprot:CAMPEP_0184684316 /NCGR_PEP_ID=MMETSP0312-20130426/14837_1 /TAXON_ID=31354 /ORGANISM="Compsopogon coeruleus, Strain SAG 36.94" /LENGTH=114 /DNA_ID=CAMNT_0027137395 /DNA_START=87 /DNA_END=428 /DNA_ORIENTATION=-
MALSTLSSADEMMTRQCGLHSSDPNTGDRQGSTGTRAVPPTGPGVKALNRQPIRNVGNCARRREDFRSSGVKTEPPLAHQSVSAIVCLTSRLVPGAAALSQAGSWACSARLWGV